VWKSADGIGWVKVATSVQKIADLIQLAPRGMVELAAAGGGQQDNGWGDWTTAVDEGSGQTYYYNNATGESQWESPW
jgi:hypothetical protein